MAEEFVTRGDLEALRSELKEGIHHVHLEVADWRTDMVERFGAVQAEFGAVRANLAGVRKDLAVLQVDIRKDRVAFDQQQDQMRQDMRDMQQEMNPWRLKYDATTADDGERGHWSHARGYSQAGILPYAVSLRQQDMVLHGVVRRTHSATDCVTLLDVSLSNPRVTGSHGICIAHC